MFHPFDNSRFSWVNPSILCADPDSLGGGGGGGGEGGGRGGNFDFSFKLMRVERRENPSTTKSGPASARQRSAIYMAFRLHADDGPTLKAGLVAL